MDEKTPLLSNDPAVQGNTGSFVSTAEASLVNHQPTINCQVCGHLITIENLEKQIVVRCSECTEATPIKGPPAGKQYVRCPCNCLLICNTTTTKVGCPRPSCQKVIILHDTENEIPQQSIQHVAHNPYGTSGTFGPPLSLRVTCGNCSSPFSVANSQPLQSSRQSKLITCLSGGTSTGTAGLIAARCPRCHKMTSVGRAYARVRLVVYGLLALAVFIIAVSVTCGTVESAKQNKALYFLWSVLYLIAAVLGLRALLFLFMPVSSVDVPVLQI